MVDRLAVIAHPERITMTTCSDCESLGDTGPRPTGCSHRWGERGVQEYVRADLYAGAVDALREAREQMTDPSTGSARPNCLAPRMPVDRALATLGGQ